MNTPKEQPISPENALSIQHKDWLLHPVTRQLVQIIESHRENVTDAISRGAFRCTPEEHKMSAVILSTIDTIKKYTTQTEQFLYQLNHK